MKSSKTLTERLSDIAAEADVKFVYDAGFLRVSKANTEANKLLDAMSPDIRALVVKDAEFRFLSVLKAVRDNRVQKQIGIGKLYSVLSQLTPHVSNNENRKRVAGEWGSW